MAKIDRLGWKAGISFVSYGLRIGIRVNEPAVLPRLLERLPPAWQPAASPVVRQVYSLFVGGAGTRPGVRRFHLAYGGPIRLARTMELDDAIDRLESDLRLYVALWAHRRVFVHAGVVGWKEKAIVLPGPSHSGKSSLVAALIRSGATYYSDEYAVLDARGRVHPYPAPLSLRTPGERPVRQAPTALASPAALKPLTVGLVAVSQYRPRSQWRPQSLTRGQGILALLANTVPARLKPAMALSTLRRAISHAPILKGARGEAEAMVDLLLKRGSHEL